MENHVDVAEVSVNRRAEYWQDYICDLVIGADTKVSSPANFYGAIESTPLQFGSWSRVSASKHKAQRSPSRIRRSEDDTMMVFCQLSGEMRIQSDDQHLCIKPGDFMIYDTSVPYLMDVVDDIEHVVFKVQRDAFFRLVPLPKSRLIHRIGAEAPLAGIVRQFVNEITRSKSNIPQKERDYFSEMALQMINRMIEADRPDNVVVTRHTHTLLFAIKQYIATRLADEYLSPAEIAGEFNVSHRYINKLFANEGCSVTKWITRQRLEWAGNLLRQSACVHQSVTDIAFTCGFRDLNSFSKAFRKHFGLSPREYRLSGC